MNDLKKRNYFFLFIIGIAMILIGLVDTIRNFEISGMVILFSGVILMGSGLYNLIFRKEK